MLVLYCVYDWFSMMFVLYLVFVFFFFKQKTAYEMRISDWSSDVCSSDLAITNVTIFDGTGTDPYPGEVLIDGNRITSVSAPGKTLEKGNAQRSEERRVGKECVSTCRYRWSPYHYKKKKKLNRTKCKQKEHQHNIHVEKEELS